jgi:hypothetical protein
MEQKVVIKNRNDFQKLFFIMKEEQNGISYELHLEVDSLSPLDILVITQFIIVQRQKRCPIIISTNFSIKKYVKAIKLVDFVKTNTHKANTIRAIPDFTAMPIKRVERERMFEYINATATFFKSIIEDSKDLAMLTQCMSELINNVYDHSQSAIGAYVFCQYYPDSNEIKMAVSDYGIGIPASVNDSRRKDRKSVLSEIDCLKWAVKENNSIHSIPRNAGKGLDIVSSFVKKNKGSWRLLSGNAQIKGSSSRNNYSPNIINNFKGTLIEITIKIDNLEVVDIIEDFTWD